MVTIKWLDTAFKLRNYIQFCLTILKGMNSKSSKVVQSSNLITSKQFDKFYHVRSLNIIFWDIFLTKVSVLQMDRSLSILFWNRTLFDAVKSGWCLKKAKKMQSMSRSSSEMIFFVVVVLTLTFWLHFVIWKFSTEENYLFSSCVDSCKYSENTFLHSERKFYLFWRINT